MARPLSCTLPLLAACAGPSVAAQTFVVPAVSTVFDANASSGAPFTYDAFRFQQTWDGGEIATTQATLHGIAWRRDTQDNAAFGAGTVIPSLDVSLGIAATTPGTMARDFASNRAGALTLVFRGPLNLPPQPPAIVIANFNVFVPFTTSWVFPAVGNALLLELEAPGRAALRSTYTLDAAYFGADGLVTRFGASGLFPGGRAALMTFDASTTGTPLRTITPGGACALRVGNLPWAVPTVIAFGLSTTLAGGMLLPLDLGPFGAVGNSLYVSPDALTGTLTPSPIGTTWAADFRAPIPNNPALVGASWFNQSFSLDASANALGAVFSNGMSVVVGGQTAPSPTQQLFSSDSSSTSGSLGLQASSIGNLAAGAIGGLVVEFHGTRQ